MRRNAITACICSAAILAATSAPAEVPPLSFLVSANATTHFGKVVPVVKHLREKGVKEIDFATHDHEQVSVAIRLRSDIKVLSPVEYSQLIRDRQGEGKMFFRQRGLDAMAEALKEAGADQVTIERVAILSTEPFSQEAFAKARDQKRGVVVICLADWDLPSRLFSKNVIENEEVIRKVNEENVSVLVADLTESDEETEAFLKKYRANPLSVLVFQPRGEAPIVLRRSVSAAAFLDQITEDD